MYNVHVAQHWTPWHLLQRNESLDLNKNLHVNVHSSFIQNDPNLEKIHILIGNCINKQLYIWALESNHQRGIYHAIHNHVD